MKPEKKLKYSNSNNILNFKKSVKSIFRERNYVDNNRVYLHKKVNL